MSERIHLTEDELKETTFLGGPPSSSSSDDQSHNIPILHRTAAAAAAASSSSQNDGDNKEEYASKKTPVVVIVVGMAGSGKTTLMTQLQRSLQPPTDETTINDNNNNNNNNNNDNGKVGYSINLDPATQSVPFPASIDIRDTVDYKQVMTQHNLGPNGAIMTSLNLFATKFDQVVSILDSRSSSSNLDYILVDTPGQIEAFTWSASGTIITGALASSFPTVLVFVVDTPRCAASPNTFMSNMLYACSILYRTKLPLLVAFNKTDVTSCEGVMEWMTDFESFQSALDERGEECGYYGSLTRSLSLVLDEFYSNLHKVGVSAATGEGVEDFWDRVDEAARDFETGYLEDLKCRIEEQKSKTMAIKKAQVRRMEKDLEEVQDDDQEE